jgi:putative hydrolase of the HAD superfamily
MEKWVFFDVMGVVFVVGDDTNDLLVPFIKEINQNISVEEINKAYIEASLGSISSHDFWLSMGINNHDYEVTEKEYLNKKLKLDEYIPIVFKELFRYYNIGLISNDVSEWSCYLREKYNLNRYLKFSVISGDIKCRKPQKQIYEYALKQAKCSPDECVFIDDRLKNLYPAMELGMNVIKFNRDEENDYSLDLPQTKDMSEIPFIIDTIFKKQGGK